MKIQTLTLPWPPSVNHYYRHVGARVLISKAGRQYRQRVKVAALLARTERIDGDIEINIDFYPPDNRRRDVDNLLKALLDALQKAGVYRDDSQIKQCKAAMFLPVSMGRVVVTLAPIKIKAMTKEDEEKLAIARLKIQNLEKEIGHYDTIGNSEKADELRDELNAFVGREENP